MYVDIFNTENKYSIIYADPPWSYKAWAKGGNGCARNHYGTMTKQDIYNLPVGGLPPMIACFLCGVPIRAWSRG